MKIKLWLDDIRPMPAGFNMLAKTAENAIDCLATGQVTDISFDHDLSDISPNEETGYTVACWIERAAFENRIPPLNWGIHSSNPSGRQSIIRAMASAERFWEANGWSFDTARRP